MDQYRGAAGVSGAGQVRDGGPSLPTRSIIGGERSLDIGVVSTAAPDSDIVLYSGNGCVFGAMQAAVWDNANRINVMSVSYSICDYASSASPFHRAYAGLAVDAALRNITVVQFSGDGGSREEYGNGIPCWNTALSSPYSLIVGGTSLTAAPQAATGRDPPGPGRAAGPGTRPGSRDPVRLDRWRPEAPAHRWVGHAADRR